MLLLYLTTVAFCFPFQVFFMTSHYMIVQSIFRPLLPPLMEQLCPPHRLNFLQPLNVTFLVWDGMTLYCYFYVVYNSVRYPKEVIKAYQDKIYLILIHYPRKVSLETLRTKKIRAHQQGGSRENTSKLFFLRKHNLSARVLQVYVYFFVVLF